MKIISGAENRPRIVNETIRKLQQDAVLGPASATNGNAALFDGTNGRLIKDAGYVPTTTGRQIISGAGLTGGGDLSADRTLAVGAGTGITVNADDVAVATNQRTASLLFFISGGVAAITTGNKLGFRVPFACTITGVSLGLDQTGSIVIDIWKDTHANFPPTVADTITASAKPTISSAVKYEDTTLTGWATAITAGDWLFFNVDSVSTAIICSINLTVLKT